jgi:hypothetical protein
MINNMKKYNTKKIWIFLRALFFVGLIIILKFAVHILGYEFLTINNLFSGIIAANVFLMGFLLSGVLSDYKESEKIPGEIATSVNNIYSELIYLYDDKKIDKSRDCMLFCQEFTNSILEWFYRRERTTSLIAKTRMFNSLFAKIENDTQANYIVRLKNEITTLMCFGLICSKIDPFYESLFFVGVISFLMIFLILLIHDLDDPFAYNKKYSAENVSLYPINRVLADIEKLNKERNIL